MTRVVARLAAAIKASRTRLETKVLALFGQSAAQLPPVGDGIARPNVDAIGVALHAIAPQEREPLRRKFDAAQVVVDVVVERNRQGGAGRPLRAQAGFI